MDETIFHIFGNKNFNYMCDKYFGGKPQKELHIGDRVKVGNSNGIIINKMIPKPGDLFNWYEVEFENGETKEVAETDIILNNNLENQI